MANTIEQIYQASRQGLDILLDLYPDARECVEGTKKKFRIREADRTPSASIRKKPTKWGDLWMVTDFGGDGREHSPLDAYMQEHGIRQEYVKEAILQLAERYGVTEHLSAETNKPDVEERAATIDELDGRWYLRFKESFTKEELEYLGPCVTQEHCDLLHWKSVESITKIYQRRAKVIRSNASFPIFARECPLDDGETAGDNPAPDTQPSTFYKIYQPKSFDKALRFTYYPRGVMPKGYVHGLAELKKRWREFNAQEEAEAKKINPEASYREQKLPEAVLCSGERDALCCLSQGYMPLWRNSETVPLDEKTYKVIMRHAETLYNIPDLDETGIRKGRELALQYIDIRTAWLDPWLSTYKDNRGHGRKDLRDWMELRRRRDDFRNLLRTALPARWWTETINDKGKRDLRVDTACLFHFLKMNGFGVLKDQDSGEICYVQADGYKVDEVKPRDIKEFLKRWVVARHEDRSVLNLVLNTQKLGSASLDGLDSIELDFKNYDMTRQVFFFDNTAIEVTAEGLNEYRDRGGKGGCVVWARDVIPHRIDKRRCPEFFSIHRESDPESGEPVFDIDIKSTRSHFFAYLVNTSRLHWRKEMETRFATREEREAYARANRFRIDGEGLTAREIREQKQCLLNKMFTVGYMLHRYKSPSKAWAPMAMDYKIGEEGQCNGRSGKSFFFAALGQLLQTVNLSGKQEKLLDNPHVYAGVSRYTDMVLVDDCGPYTSIERFYDAITTSMTINKKNVDPYTLKFEDSPKFAFSTNYVPAKFDASDVGRLLYMVFSDYYHVKSEDDDYLETRQIGTDFGKDLYTSDYTEEEWNDDLVFMLECCRFYMSVAREGVKIQPPMANIMTRKLKADMGTTFEDWATGYFSEDSGRLDTELNKIQVIEDLKRESPSLQKMTSQNFMKKLRAFCELSPYIDCLNPEEMRNSSGRIQRKETGQAPGLPAKTVDIIYLRTVKEAERLKGAAHGADAGSIEVPPGETDAAKGDTPF